MSLRDRIAKTLHGISCSHLDIEVDWASEYEGVRARFYEDADAILADPEIAALREVAEAAKSEVDAEFAFDPSATQRARRGVARRVAEATKRKRAALARLEEARK